MIIRISSVRNLEVLPTNKKPGREETNEQAEVWKNPVMKLYAVPIEFRGVGPLAHCWHPHPSNTRAAWAASFVANISTVFPCVARLSMTHSSPKAVMKRPGVATTMSFLPCKRHEGTGKSCLDRRQP